MRWWLKLKAKFAWLWRVGVIRRMTAFRWEMDAALGEQHRPTPALRSLAEKAALANEEWSRRLAAMSPEEREKAINEWAEKLANDLCQFDD